MENNVYFREESDSLGQMCIPDHVYYGVQTERARQNFAITGNTMGLQFTKLIFSIAAIKKAAALAHWEIGVISEKVALAIGTAADEIMNGDMQQHFPIDVFQGGGGTSINMNVNEVIANRANELMTGIKGNTHVHPNTHVNCGQSTNDVIPSALKMSLYVYLQELKSALSILEKELSLKVHEFKDVVKIARTCLQDAVPITLGQEFSGYLSFVERQKKIIENISKECLFIPLGATAVGTGIGTYRNYLEKVYLHLRDITNLPLQAEENFFDALQNGDIYIRISCSLKSLATGLSKMATDFRILSSGPRAGFREINLPELQPGSSIMPGKINPVLPELVNQVAYQICGNDLTVTMAVEGGELDLNVWEPIITKSLFESCQILTNVIPLFAEKCIKGITANAEICREYAEASISLSTVVSTLFGYEVGSKVAKMAVQSDSSIKEVVVQLGILNHQEAQILLDPANLTSAERFHEQIIQFKKNNKIGVHDERV